MQIEPALRASDTDREQVAERLRHATAEGRLSGDEFGQRLEALYEARTYGELDALVDDLPANRSLGQPRAGLGRVVGAVGAVGAVTLVLAVLAVLAIMRGHSAVAVLGAGHRHLNLPGPLAGPHQGLIVAASLGVVCVVLLTSAVLVGVLVGSRLARPRSGRPAAEGHPDERGLRA